MKTKKWIASLLTLSFLCTLVLAVPGCGDSGKGTIRVGSKDFTESLILW